PRPRSAAHAFRSRPASGFPGASGHGAGAWQGRARRARTRTMTQALFDLSGRAALVTGAGRGLGREIARALAGAGARVWLNGRDPAPLQALAAEIGAAGGRAEPLPFDVADETAAATAVEGLERLDILVNNVGQRDRRSLD